MTGGLRLCAQLDANLWISVASTLASRSTKGLLAPCKGCFCVAVSLPSAVSKGVGVTGCIRACDWPLSWHCADEYCANAPSSLWPDPCPALSGLTLLSSRCCPSRTATACPSVLFWRQAISVHTGTRVRCNNTSRFRAAAHQPTGDSRCRSEVSASSLSKS